MNENVAEKSVSPQPEPAIHHVWDAGPGQIAWRNGPEAIQSIDDGRVVFRSGAFTSASYLSRCCRCIGIETPAGRVMVGERRQSPDGSAREVMAVCAYASLTMRNDKGYESRVTAIGVAHWPIADAPICAPGTLAAERAKEAAKGPRARLVAIAGPNAIVNCHASGHVHITLPASTSRSERATVEALARGEMPMTLSLTVEIADPAVAAVVVGIDRLLRSGYKLDPGAVARVAGSPSFINPPLNPRAAARAAIDAILKEDARRFPAFATARKAAVLAAYEGAPPFGPAKMVPVSHAASILRDCHRYEVIRGGMTKPSESAASWVKLAGGPFAVALAVYERVRGAHPSSPAAHYSLPFSDVWGLP